MIWTWQRRCEFLVTTKGSFRNHDSDTEDHVERIYILLSNPTAPPRVIYFVYHCHTLFIIYFVYHCQNYHETKSGTQR